MGDSYWVCFTKDKEQELNPDSKDLVFSVVIAYAENAKEARHIAWKTVNRHPGLRFIKREGWRICHSGLAREVKAPGPIRGPRISVGYRKGVQAS
jgi:hypothetical protein